MKNLFSLSLPRGLALLLLSGMAVPAAFAQGGLDPQGIPGETMRSLEEIEPRTPYSQEEADRNFNMFGHTYLTEDIELQSERQLSGVLDLNGYTITPSPSFSGNAALRTSGRFIIRNGKIKGFLDGLEVRGDVFGTLNDAQIAVIENITFEEITGAGVFTAGSRALDHITIRDCRFLGLGFARAGIDLGLVSTVVIDNCHFNSFPRTAGTDDYTNGYGFRLGGDSTVDYARPINVTIKNSSVSRALHNGLHIRFVESEGHATITNCSFTKNGEAGLRNVYVFTPMTVIDTVAAENGGSGFLSTAPATYEGCTARNNDGDGFNGFGFSSYTNCIATDNDGDGFDDEAGTQINNCESSFNQENGFVVGVRSQIIDSKATWNVGTGMNIGSRSTISGSLASANGKPNSRTGDTENTSADGAITGDDCMIIDSSFTDNRRAGLSVGGGNGLVDRVFIGANDTYALRLNDSRISVRNSVINPEDSRDPEIVNFSGNAISGGDIAPIPDSGSNATHPAYNDN